MDDEELEKLAVEEILKETKRGAERAKEQGALGWQKCPLPATNKRFLKNMLVGTLRNLDNRKRKYNNYDDDYPSKRRDKWKTRRRNSDYDYERDYDREERSVRNHRDTSKYTRHTHGKDKEHKRNRHRSKHKKDNDKKDKKHRSKKKSSKKHKKKDSEKAKC